MRRILIISTMCILLFVLLISCKLKPIAGKEKPLIITTIYPYELIVKQLVDTLFTVETLLPPNASPHTWSPAPQDIMKLEKADVIIANGLGLETNLEKTLNKAGIKLITVSNFIDEDKLIHSGKEHDQAHDAEHEHGVKHEQNTGQKHEHEAETEAEHHHEGANPHIWTSPELLTEIMIGLTAELSKRYPMHKAALESNSRLMIMEIFQVDGKIKTLMQNYNNPAVITAHDAFVYFFKYFHIDYIGSVQPSAGKDPAPQQLKELADAIKARKIKAIFIEPEMNPRPAKVLADELKLQVIQYDVLGTFSQAKTISEYLWWNWNALKAGL